VNQNEKKNRSEKGGYRQRANGEKRFPFYKKVKEGRTSELLEAHLGGEEGGRECV